MAKGPEFTIDHGNRRIIGDYEILPLYGGRLGSFGIVEIDPQTLTRVSDELEDVALSFEEAQAKAFELNNLNVSKGLADGD